MRPPDPQPEEAGLKLSVKKELFSRIRIVEENIVSEMKSKVDVDNYTLVPISADKKGEQETTFIKKLNTSALGRAIVSELNLDNCVCSSVLGNFNGIAQLKSSQDLSKSYHIMYVAFPRNGEITAEMLQERCRETVISGLGQGMSIKMPMLGTGFGASYSLTLEVAAKNAIKGIFGGLSEDYAKGDDRFEDGKVTICVYRPRGGGVTENYLHTYEKALEEVMREEGVSPESDKVQPLTIGGPNTEEGMGLPQ